MDDVYVVDEASTYLSDAVRAAGIALSETPHEIPRDGELSPASFAPRSDAMSPLTFPPREDLPARPPALCADARIASCSRSFRVCARSSRAISAATPSVRFLLCRLWTRASTWGVDFHGARLRARLRGIFIKAGSRGHRRFDLRSLGFELAYLHGVQLRDGTVCVLDNRTTAMTGRQGNPFNGVTLQKPHESGARSRRRRALAWHR